MNVRLGYAAAGIACSRLKSASFEQSAVAQRLLLTRRPQATNAIPPPRGRKDHENQEIPQRSFACEQRMPVTAA